MLNVARNSKPPQLSLHGVTYWSVCRYVQYYADMLGQQSFQPKKLQLWRVTVRGLPANEIKDLVLGVWSRPPGAGWKTNLLCLAVANSHAGLLEGQSCSYMHEIVSISRTVSNPSLREILAQRPKCGFLSQVGYARWQMLFLLKAGATVCFWKIKNA